MEFESETAAHLFYLSYAKAVGFGVRYSKAHPDKVTGKIWDRIFCCSREGKRKKDVRDANVKSHRPETRCQCSAEIKISCRQTDKNQSGNYRIIRFIAEHNHGCATPSKSHLFRSHRRMSDAQKAEVDIAISCGIAQRETMELMAKQVGGPQFLGFISDDCKNYLRSKRTHKMRPGDAGGVVQYLQKKQVEDPNFSYAIQMDEDDFVTNILWTDAKMRSDYSYYGDVVSFDTTYRKHKDGRPIALFVGVNNHKQTIIFGAALLYDETAVTFSWLFETFATTMLGKKPQTLLTDQDKAMSKAISSEWPETYHRLCIWHINQNAAMHLANIFSQFKEFSEDFSSCIYDYEDEDEFIDAWYKMIEKYNLQENKWLAGLFEIRKKWALVYGRETFCADMSTTQRSESMNSVIKKYVNYKNDLTEFFENFESLVRDRRYKESRADFRTSQSVPSLKLHVKIVKHAASIYTQEIFELFQKEVWKAYDYDLEVCDEKDTITTFKVSSDGNIYPRHVTYDSADGSMSCSCKKFEFVGILCSHTLKVLNFKNIVKVPHQYVKKRWTKTAKIQRTHVGSQDISQVDPKDAMSFRYKYLSQTHTQLVIKAAETPKAYEIAKLGLQKLVEQIYASFEEGEASEPMGGIVVKDVSISCPVSVAFVENGVINSKKVRGIKAKEKITYKTSKRPKNCLEKGTRKRKISRLKDGDSASMQQNSFSQGSELIPTLDSCGNKDMSINSEATLSEDLHLRDWQSYSMQAPYSSANLHLHQNSSLTDLLKKVDPNIIEQSPHEFSSKTHTHPPASSLILDESSEE